MKPKGKPTSKRYGQKDDATITPFANRGRLPMVPMFTNTLLIFCISIPCGWLLQKPLYFIRINPLLLTFTNILWTILIYYLIDSLCCGWFLQTPCWYFVLSIPWSWFLQTPHGSLYILIGSTPVVDFYTLWVIPYFVFINPLWLIFIRTLWTSCIALAQQAFVQLEKS